MKTHQSTARSETLVVCLDAVDILLTYRNFDLQTQQRTVFLWIVVTLFIQSCRFLLQCRLRDGRCSVFLGVLLCVSRDTTVSNITNATTFSSKTDYCCHYCCCVKNSFQVGVWIVAHSAADSSASVSSKPTEMRFSSSLTFRICFSTDSHSNRLLVFKMNSGNSEKLSTVLMNTLKAKLSLFRRLSFCYGWKQQICIFVITISPINKNV